MNPSERPNLGRHAANCSVCKHPKRDDIEEDFLAWEPIERICRSYKITNRSSVYRHARAFDLMAQRGRNLCGALDLVIEQAGNRKPSASAIIAAIVARAKINAQGEWVDRENPIRLQDLMDRLSAEERENYAKEGKLPLWFREIVVSAGGRLPEEPDDKE